MTTDSSLTCPFCKTTTCIRIKSIPTMRNNSVVSFYDNFGLIYKRSEDKMTNGIENWSLSTTPLVIDGSSHKNRSQYPHKPYISRNYSLWRTYLSIKVQKYLHSFFT